MRLHAPSALLLMALGILATAILLGYAAFLFTLSPTADHLPACPTEDSDNCYWDATTHGNGQGRSFYTIDGVTYYLGE